jgi:hypothetical protein
MCRCGENGLDIPASQHRGIGRPYRLTGTPGMPGRFMPAPGTMPLPR